MEVRGEKSKSEVDAGTEVRAEKFEVEKVGHSVALLGYPWNTVLPDTAFVTEDKVSEVCVRNCLKFEVEASLKSEVFV